MPGKTYAGRAVHAAKRERGIPARLSGGFGGRCSVPARHQAGLQPRSGILVDQTLLHSLVNAGKRYGEQRLGLFAGLRLQTFARGAQLGAERSPVHAIDGGALFGLTGALEGGKVIRHIVSGYLGSTS